MSYNQSKSCVDVRFACCGKAIEVDGHEQDEEVMGQEIP